MKPLSSNRPTLVACATLLLAVCVATPAVAQWKWRDKTGQVTVSDMPPPRDVSDKDILQRPSDDLRRRPAAPPAAASAPASGAATDAHNRVDPELEARRKKAEQEQSAQRKQEEERKTADRAENCKLAQAHLRSLESGMRIARVNDKGEREILDDKQIAQEQQRARNVVSADCR